MCQWTGPCIGSGNGLSPDQHQAIYLNQHWLIVNWTLMSKLHWNLNQNTKFFIHDNAYENAVCEMATILSRGRWVKRTPYLIISIGKLWDIYCEYCGKNCDVIMELHCTVICLTMILNSLLPGRRGTYFKIIILNSLYRTVAWALSVKLLDVNATEPHWWELNINHGTIRHSWKFMWKCCLQNGSHLYLVCVEQERNLCGNQ